MKVQQTAKRLVVGIWLLLVCTSGLYCAWRIAEHDAFTSNVLALLPTSTSAMRPQIVENDNLQKQFLVLVNDAHGGARASALHQALAKLPNVQMDQDFTATLNALKQQFFPYRHQLLSRQAREKLQNSSPQALADEALASLYNPLSGFRPYALTDDPFNLASSWYMELFPLGARVSPGDIPALRDGKATWYLLRGALRSSPFDVASQNALDNAIKEFRARSPDTELLLSGIVFHATQATAIIRQDISTVGVGSMLGIVLLMIAVFRRAKAIFAVLLTMATSMVVALAASLVVFGQIHLLTLAFGSTLLGLCVDYCSHFLVKLRHSGNGLVAGRLIARGLAVSAGSTILAYLVQLLSPFPALHQFAVFIACGLAAACLQVAVLAYCYNDVQQHTPTPWFSQFVMPCYRWMQAHRRTLVTLCALVVVATVALLVKSGSSDDIRLLNTSSADLVNNENRIGRLLGGLETQRYWIVTGDSLQQVLERSDAMLAGLPGDSPVMATSQLVPSQRQQKLDHELVMQKLYAPGGALELLCDRLQSDCSVWRGQDYRFHDGLDSIHLAPEISDAFPVLTMAGDHHAVILPYRSDNLASQPFAAAPLPEGVAFVDKVADLTATLATFRVKVTELLVMFCGLFAVICLWLYASKAWAVIIPVVVSLAAALAPCAAAGITLFHVLALVLVAGIAIDSAVFYQELGLDEDTWLAATLAMVTSNLAFGLLALSQVPVLQQFGKVVFVGLFTAWVLTPVLYLMVNSREKVDTIHEPT